jgi:predicted sugar kinase
MQIELATPACLLLGMAPLDGQVCQLGITLRHPPIHLTARPAQELAVTGGRADLAARQAAAFLAHHSLPPGAEIEIELAIPSFMGLGSSPMLGLSVARALAALHTLPEDAAALGRAVELPDDEALDMHAFAGGGLLAVGGDSQIVRRQAVAHDDEERDWVFVFVLPRVPAGLPESLEADRRRALLDQVGSRGAESAPLADQLWAAAERDDLAAFAEALAELHEWNESLLEAAGMPIALVADEQAILDVMRAGGALVCGQAIGGRALYALVAGADASRELRRTLQQQLGFFGGTVMATICDNQGARLKTSTD